MLETTHVWNVHGWTWVMHIYIYTLLTQLVVHGWVNKDFWRHNQFRSQCHSFAPNSFPLTYLDDRSVIGSRIHLGSPTVIFLCSMRVRHCANGTFYPMACRTLSQPIFNSSCYNAPEQFCRISWNRHSAHLRDSSVARKASYLGVVCGRVFLFVCNTPRDSCCLTIKMNPRENYDAGRICRQALARACV